MRLGWLYYAAEDQWGTPVGMASIDLPDLRLGCHPFGDLWIRMAGPGAPEALVPDECQWSHIEFGISAFSTDPTDVCWPGAPAHG